MAAYRRKPKRSTSSRARTRRGAKGNGIWYFAIAICTLLVVGAITGSRLLISKSRIDEKTLCHVGGAINVTALLLDLTDPLSKTQQTRLKTIIENEISNSSTDTMIALGIVDEDPTKWGARFAKCKPATGKNANALYENPALISERYAREFTDPIRSTLLSMLTRNPENQSPIMEALQSLVSETPYFMTAKGERKIVIVSDMLQHSSTLSFYRGQGWEYFVKQNGPQRLAGNLSGVSVKIVRVPRSGKNIPPRVVTDEFWSRYFDRQGSQAPSVRSLGDL